MENMNLSDKSKEALKSETWQELGEDLREEIVKEYLKSRYTDESKQHDMEVSGTTYKVLERVEITTFYDSLGNTLFNVENKELAAKYDELAKAGNELNPVDEKAGNGDVAEEENVDLDQEEENSEAGETQEEQSEDEEEADPDDGAGNNMIPMGKVSLKEVVMGLPAPTAEEIASAKEENAKPVKQQTKEKEDTIIKQMAKEKLEKEMKAAKDKTFAEPVIGYLLKRCEEDLGLAQDVVQEQKTWEKCFDYIWNQARKQSKRNCAAVRDDVVYEWAEDYYHKDDKAEEEKKAKEAAERKEKQEERAKKAKSEPKKAKVPKPKETPKPKVEPKPKKNSKDMDGQLDMFSMMGM